MRCYDDPCYEVGIVAFRWDKSEELDYFCPECTIRLRRNIRNHNAGKWEEV
jgi:hypothetical protein